MNILIIQSDGEHKGQDSYCRNDYLRECHAIQYAFQQNGHIVDKWGLRHENFNQIPRFDSYDLIFIIENYEFSWMPDLSKIKSAKMYWIIDQHCAGINHYYNIAKNCDYILNSTKSLIPIAKQKLPNKYHVWFPNGVDSRYFYNYHMDKTEDIIFVGSGNGNRQQELDYLKTNIGMSHVFETGRNMINIISSAKMHFNKSIGCDVNYRCFETIGLGTCLLTNKIEEMSELGFIHGENCLLYNSINELKELIADCLSTESWKEISDKAIILSNENTYIMRVKKLLDNI